MFRRVAFVLVIIIIYCLLLLVSCSKDDNSINASNNKIDNVSLVGTNIAWKEDLMTTLTKLKAEGVFDEHFMDGYAVALFDLNYDGVPEIIEVEAGGSSGGVNYIAYDMSEGNVVATFSGGVFHSEHSDAWCVYLDTETDRFKMIENSTTRGGSTVLKRHISELVWDDILKSYTEKNLFYINYDIEETVVDGELVEGKVMVDHYYCDGNVSVSEYNYQYDLFIASHIRIFETGMKLIRWVDVEDKNNPDTSVNNMVEALLSSGQKFVNVIDGEENE